MFTISTSDIDNPIEFRTIQDIQTLNLQAKRLMFKYQKQCLRFASSSLLSQKTLGVHPDFPFAKIFTFVCLNNFPHILFPQSMLCFFWFLLHLHYIAIEIPVHILYKDLIYFRTHPTLPRQNNFLINFLTWFQSLEEWEDLCAFQLNISTERWTTVILKRAVMFNNEGTSFFQAFIEEYHHSPFQKYSVEYSPQLRIIQKYLFEKNQIIPPSLWPSLSEDAPWDLFQPGYNLEYGSSSLDPTDIDPTDFEPDPVYASSSSVEDSGTSPPPSNF